MVSVAGAWLGKVRPYGDSSHGMFIVTAISPAPMWGSTTMNAQSEKPRTEFESLLARVADFLTRHFVIVLGL
jgi:hypothetical protein